MYTINGSTVVWLPYALQHGKDDWDSELQLGNLTSLEGASDFLGGMFDQL